LATNHSGHHEIRLSVVLTVPESVHPHIEALAAGIVFSGPDDGRPVLALRLRGEEDAIPLLLGPNAAATIGAALIAAAGQQQDGTIEMAIDQ
jgi:hypothetical protein